MKHTYDEDGTPTDYITDGLTATSLLTSIEDLIITLQDPAVGYSSKVSGWITIINKSTQSADIANNWSLLMKSYMTALAGKTPAFMAYINAVTSDTFIDSDTIKITPPLVAAGTTTVNLKMSGFMIGKTKVASTTSTLLSDAADTGTDAYLLAWNGAIPSFATISAGTNTLSQGAIAFNATDLTEPAAKANTMLAKSFSASDYLYNRTMSKPSSKVDFVSIKKGVDISDVPLGRADAIPGNGNTANPTDGTTTGKLSCVYVAY